MEIKTITIIFCINLLYEVYYIATCLGFLKKLSSGTVKYLKKRESKPTNAQGWRMNSLENFHIQLYQLKVSLTHKKNLREINPLFVFVFN